MAKASIEWADATWNPLRGCTKISPGCARCYAEVFAERFRGVGGHPYERGFDPRLVPNKLAEPLLWSTPPDGIRQFDERFVSERCSGRLHQRRGRDHGECFVAHVSGTDEACGSYEQTAQRP